MTKEKKSGPGAAGEGRGESWRGRVANGTRMGRTGPGGQERRGRDWSATRLLKNDGRAEGQKRRRAAGAGRGRGDKGTEQRLAVLGIPEGQRDKRKESGPGAAGEGRGLKCDPPFQESRKDSSRDKRKESGTGGAGDGRGLKCDRIPERQRDESEGERA